MRRVLTVAAAAVVFAGVARAQEPELPVGLGGEEPAAGEPELPVGLESGEQGARAPAPSSEAERDLAARLRELGLTGFFDLRFGSRTQRDPHERDLSIAEARLRLEWERTFDPVTVRLAGDLLADALADRWTPELETGAGWFDLREASVAASPWSFMDVRLGRQVLTWGTGDLLFINDLFPKDWVSFFVGRDDEYLKAPSDALRIGLFSEVANFDLAWTPRFDPDRFIRGERVSYYNPMLGRRAGRDAVADPIVPDDWGADGELSGRLHRNFDGLELAAYGYHGRWKSPGGFDPGSGQATFPRLSVYGASARTQLAGGIANAEVGYYDSRQDAGGGNPNVSNSELRALLGFERDLPEIADALTVGAQYYLEAMLGHADYERTLPPGVPVRDELRHVVTLRVTKLLLEQRLRLSLFAYLSPSDVDGYVRPSASYTIDDQWSVSVGANVFFGEDPFTFFGQFERNTNVFVAARWSF
ncbi:MAG: hypothetical protein KDE27_21415 [Planctomycetes bacterium]|nr:hypothetical protein [Planctomycetota bacterium]